MSPVPKKARGRARKNPAVEWVSVKLPAAVLEEAREVRVRVLAAGREGLPEGLRDAIRLDVRRVGLAQVLHLGLRALAAELEG